MSNIRKIGLSFFACAVLIASPSICSADLIGSLLLENAPSPNTNQQTYSGLATRTSIGNIDTRGNIAGTLSVAAGHEVGADSYDGVDIGSFSFTTNFTDLTRFANNSGEGGLIVWDFDLTPELTGTVVGSGAGETSYSLDVDFTGRRTSGGIDGQWFVSVNGNGLALDASDITNRTFTGATSGVTNGALVADTALYSNVLTSAANAGSGILSVDITQFIAAAQASDGLIRIAYLEPEFRGDINIQNGSGINSSVNAIPEPSAGLVLAIVAMGLGLRRRTVLSTVGQI